LYLNDLLRNHLEPQPLRNVTHRTMKYSGRTVCLIEVSPADRDVWFRPRTAASVSEFCIREGPSSRTLRGPEITEYCRRRFWV
jgi:hypothetical protein